MHDVTTIFYARRLYPNQTPVFFPPAASAFNILFLGVCAFVYAIATAMAAFSASAALDGEISWDTPANSGTVLAQAILSAICMVLLLTEAVWCIRSRSEVRLHGYGEF
jgi:hypothetical protein